MITPLRRITGFMPYVMVLFCNAFVDLGHKIVVQNTVFKVYDGEWQITLTAIVNAFILLPFVLLLTPSGYLADKYPKHWVMRLSALMAIVITLLITLCYYQQWFWGAYGLTFVLAIQSAFYSPAKFGYIKELVGKSRLSEANGVVQGTTMVSILLGIFVFSALFEWRLSGQTYQTEADIMREIAPLGWALVAGATIEAILAFRIVPTGHEKPQMRFDWPEYRRGVYLKHTLHAVIGHKTIWLSVLGLSIFWSISQVMFAAFPAHAKASMGEVNTLAIQGAMAAAGIGIALGSNLAGRLSRGRIELGLIPFGAVGFAVCLLLVPYIDVLWLHAFNFALLGFLGGVFVVPLNALIQFHAKEKQAGRTLAANNFIQNIFMLSFLLFTVLSSTMGISASHLFIFLTVLGLVSALYTLYKLPQSLIRFLLGRLFSAKYRMEVMGLNHMPESGGVLLLGNHVSWIDWAVLQMACPRRIHFVMERSIYERWYLKRFLDSFGVIPISKGHYQDALESIRQRLNEGHVVCLFPEGAISRNGQLGTFKRGFEKAAEGVEQGCIIPFYLRGLWGGSFSRSGQALKQERRDSQQHRDLIVAFGPPLPMHSQAVEVKQRVFDLSVSAWQKHAEALPSLGLAFIQRAKRHPSGDLYYPPSGRPISQRKMFGQAALMARQIHRQHTEERIGLMAPFGMQKLLGTMALLLAGKTIVPLSPRLSSDKLARAIQECQLRSILISDDLPPLPAHLPNACQSQSLSSLHRKHHKLTMSLLIYLPTAWLRRWMGTERDIEKTAVLHSQVNDDATQVETTELNHLNVHSNIKQIADVLNMHTDDRILEVLPTHHPYGLAVNALLPCLEGIPLVGADKPEDAESLAKSAARHQASLLFATPAQLCALTECESVHPLMLRSLRLVISGHGLLSDAERQAFCLKFSHQPYEGFGLPQTVSAISANLPDQLDSQFWQIQQSNKPGSVGLPLPGSRFLIVSNELLPLPPNQAGWLLVRGAQVAQNPSQLVCVEEQTWLRTQLRATLDSDGFLRLLSDA